MVEARLATIIEGIAYPLQQAMIVTEAAQCQTSKACGQCTSRQLERSVAAAHSTATRPLVLYRQLQRSDRYMSTHRSTGVRLEELDLCSSRIGESTSSHHTGSIEITSRIVYFAATRCNRGY